MDNDKYGYVKSMMGHLDCLTNQNCDFSRHLQQVSEQQPKEVKEEKPKSSWCKMKSLFKLTCGEEKLQTEEVQPRRLGEDQLVNNLNEFRYNLNNSLSNNDIKKATESFTVKVSNWLNEFEKNFPEMNKNIQIDILKLKENLPKYKQMNP